MSSKKIPDPIIEKITDVEVDDDEAIEGIKKFFSDPKTRPEADKLRHCIKYVLAEIGSQDDEVQRVEAERKRAEDGPTFTEFLFGKKRD